MRVPFRKHVFLGVVVILPSIIYLVISQRQPAETVPGRKWFEDKYNHQMKELDAETYQKLVQDGDRVPFEPLLDPMLIPRVPGTANHARVKQFIKDHMRGLGWTIETDAFQDNTPHGAKPFENIITTLNPDTPRRLVLACHYDSKYSNDDSFIGATDSAVPCAMLLHMASTMQSMLTEHKNSAHNVTLQFIFFDGEEAFQYWTSTDSIYGSRHWGRNDNDMLVLLDLLGTPNPKLYSFFQETSHWHNSLVQTEQQLKRSQFWSGSTRQTIFQAKNHYGGIEDDHIPFLQRGVDILHVIPSPFPTVWHKTSDNREALDFPTISNLNKVFRLFVARYLEGFNGGNALPIITSTSNAVGQAAKPGIMQHFLNFFLNALDGARLPIM
ncbi:Glutaminyl-peptide cyclotransferase [Orchesella cincta]|uniref:Glutaminyl-peptide cyclotransferase n=1 Tax=Orchesella cincta TaxID=48709 RepID=A0A1D2N9X5_ORCCI|nr:Glutaminyl-peptide cyclotransferase [Orchesella cincta]